MKSLSSTKAILFTCSIEKVPKRGFFYVLRRRLQLTYNRKVMVEKDGAKVKGTKKSDGRSIEVSRICGPDKEILYEKQ